MWELYPEPWVRLAKDPFSRCSRGWHRRHGCTSVSLTVGLSILDAQNIVPTTLGSVTAANDYRAETVPVAHDETGALNEREEVGNMKFALPW